MVDTIDHLEAAREMGKVLVELMEFNFAPAIIGCPIEDKGPRALREDERYGAKLTELTAVMEAFGEVEIDDEFFEVSEPHLDIRANRYVDNENIATLHVPYSADGSVVFVGEIYLENGIVHPIDHRPTEVEKIDIGRFIARAELGILSSSVQSVAESLDYWAIESSGFGESKFRQSGWANQRGISRQAVSNNINSAKEKLPVKIPDQG